MSDRDALLKAFGIELADLEANRAGRLGSAQRRNLLRNGNWDIAAALILGAMLGAILLWVADKPLVPVQWILSSLLFAAVLAAGIGYSRRTRAAAAEGRVERLVGPVRIASRGRAGRSLLVADQAFRLPVRPWQLQQGATYVVYVAPRTRTIVAMEPASSS